MPKFQWVEHCSFRVDGTPKAQPRGRAFAIKRCSNGHTFSAKKYRCPKCQALGTVSARIHDAGTAKEWKRAVWAAAQRFKTASPITLPLRVDVDFYMPRPKTFSPKVRAAYGGSSRDIPSGPVLFLPKPDRDNLDKAVLDALTKANFMADDSLVCWGTVRKFYHGIGGRPGARIRIMVWKPTKGPENDA